MQENTTNNLSINERIFQILDYYGDTRYKFSKKSGISESSILNIYKANNKPSYDFIEKVLSVYEVVNARWLLTGEGEMLNSKEPIKETVASDLPTGPCQQCEQRERVIASQAKTIALLEDKIESLTKVGHNESNDRSNDYRQTG
jgi:transcriptional regulator with XRE-family HTH domain